MQCSGVGKCAEEGGTKKNTGVKKNTLIGAIIGSAVGLAAIIGNCNCTGFHSSTNNKESQPLH
jgi:hypothetical protein